MNQATFAMLVGIPGILLKGERLPFTVTKKFFRFGTGMVVGTFIGQNIYTFKTAETACPNRDSESPGHYYEWN